MNFKKHIKYHQMCLQILPPELVSLDSNRLTLAFFGVGSLNLLNALENLGQTKSEIVKWIYSLQLTPDTEDSNLDKCGFRGSPGNIINQSCTDLDESHVANTYVALGSLLMLGDDLRGVDRRGVAAGIRALQQPDGRLVPCASGGESDMRFVFCACCSSYMIDDWSGLDTDRLTRYILSSQSYEGGFGQAPGLEAHGGSTLCAVASLHLMGHLGALAGAARERLVRWLVMRQETGFNGRPNKKLDTCYTYWVGAALTLLGVYDMVNRQELSDYVASTEGGYGGFSKWPDYRADPLHAYLGLAGLSLTGLHPGTIAELHPALNISRTAADSLTDIHARWREEPSQT